MKAQLVRIFLVLLTLILVEGVKAANVDAKPTEFGSIPLPYAVRAGGAESYVGLTNAPASNRVHISRARWDQSRFPYTAVVGITNSESCGILMWNVRVQ